jgi:hypothetical protein
VPSPLRRPPTDVFIREDGRAVAVCSRTYRPYPPKDATVIALLGPGGRVQRVFAVEELLSKDEIHLVLNSSYLSEHSGGYLQWTAYFLYRPQPSPQPSLFGFLTLLTGQVRLFDIATGARIVPSPALVQQIKADEIARIGARLAHASSPSSWFERWRAVWQLLALRDRWAAPLLIPLLKDPSVEYMNSEDRRGRPITDVDYPVQRAAGHVLALLLRTDALPYLRPRLRGANPWMRRNWQDAIDEATSPLPPTMAVY